MESTLLLIDCVAIIIAVLWFVRNATRPPGEPVGGLLRFRQMPPDRTPPNDAARPGKARR